MGKAMARAGRAVEELAAEVGPLASGGMTPAVSPPPTTAGAVRTRLEPLDVSELHNRSGRNDGRGRDDGHGGRISGAAPVIAKLQVLILLKANML
jgi:hypothetical protein